MPRSIWLRTWRPSITTSSGSRCQHPKQAKNLIAMEIALSAMWGRALPHGAGIWLYTFRRMDGLHSASCKKAGERFEQRLEWDKDGGSLVLGSRHGSLPANRMPRSLPGRGWGHPPFCFRSRIRRSRKQEEKTGAAEGGWTGETFYGCYIEYNHWETGVEPRQVHTSDDHVLCLFVHAMTEFRLRRAADRR